MLNIRVRSVAEIVNEDNSCRQNALHGIGSDFVFSSVLWIANVRAARSNPFRLIRFHRCCECKLTGINVYAERRNHWPHEEIKRSKTIPSMALLPQDIFSRNAYANHLGQIEPFGLDRFNAKDFLHDPEP